MIILVLKVAWGFTTGLRLAFFLFFFALFKQENCRTLRYWCLRTTLWASWYLVLKNWTKHREGGLIVWCNILKLPMRHCNGVLQINLQLVEVFLCPLTSLSTRVSSQMLPPRSGFDSATLGSAAECQARHVISSLSCLHLSCSLSYLWFRCLLKNGGC